MIEEGQVRWVHKKDFLKEKLAHGMDKVFEIIEGSEFTECFFDIETETAIDILNRNTSGTLALSGDDDYPYAVPISYVYADGKLYFHSAKSGHKRDAIQIRAVRKILFYCNRDGLFFINVLKGIDDRRASYDNTQERRELEAAAKLLFG